MESDKVLADVERMLIDAINTMKEIFDLSADYNEAENKQQLHALVSQTDHELNAMYEYCGNCPEQVRRELTVPLQVVRDLDDGYKPDTYGKNCVDEFKRFHENEIIRSQGLTALFGALCEEIRQQMPPDLASAIIDAATKDS